MQRTRYYGAFVTQQWTTLRKRVRANQTKNCPITSKEITNAKVVFVTHLAGVRGKTVIRTPKHVDSDSVEIPREFQLFA